MRVAHGDSDNRGDGVGDGDDASQGGYSNDTLEGDQEEEATTTTPTGGQEVLTCISEAEEAPGEAQRWE
jgi:hypothetical protein